MPSSLDSYKVARHRFVITEISRDGEPWVQIVDPATGLSGAVPIAQRAVLPQLFRGIWETQSPVQTPRIHWAAYVASYIAYAIGVGVVGWVVWTRG